MWPFDKSSKRYRPLKNQDEEGDESIDLDQQSASLSSRRPCSSTRLAIFFISCLAAAGIAYAFFSTRFLTLQRHGQEDTPQTDGLPLRHEWRTLNQAEKEHYIASARCLLTRPSALSHGSSSLYEDFPYIHAHIGYSTHNSASFLPWHRYFLHIYENALREHCNFTGTGLVYWDWTLDAAALETSPIFSPTSGFGGNGDPEGEITIGRSGRCVINGPFSDVNASYYDVKVQPHCLSRGFRNDGGESGHMDGSGVSAESIEEVLQLDNYEAFVVALEKRVHDVIPFGIGGDFETFTAPYDPLFYLHHVQLDRLWWMWQHAGGVQERMMAYGGNKQRHSMEKAQLSDEIKMGGWKEPIRVEEVMDTEAGGGLLCYRY